MSRVAVASLSNADNNFMLAKWMECSKIAGKSVAGDFDACLSLVTDSGALSNFYLKSIGQEDNGVQRFSAFNDPAAEKHGYVINGNPVKDGQLVKVWFQLRGTPLGSRPITRQNEILVSGSKSGIQSHKFGTDIHQP